MTLRIAEPNLFNTQGLLAQILPPLLHNGERVAFLCDPSEGKHVIARIRVMISRRRKGLRKPKKFRLGSSVHTETHGGKRYDCVVLWVAINESHLLVEMLEDMLSEERVIMETEKVAANG